MSSVIAGGSSCIVFPLHGRQMQLLSSAAIITLIAFFSSPSSIPVKSFVIILVLVYAYFGYDFLKRRVPKGLEIVKERGIKGVR